MLVCSSPADCAEIERRHATGIGLLVDGGASRGNLLSGEADDVILTVSRTDAEKQANPGYRAFLANGFNVTRALVLFGWEVVLELTAAHARQAARRAPPRPPRRRLSADARGDVRDRPRPDRLRRADRHDARPARGLRDVLQLRRGRPSLRPHAGRHARGAAQARPAVRPPRGRAPVRAAPVRDRRPVRPRPDPGRDVQAAQRLRARRARRALAEQRARRELRRRRRAARDGRPRGRRGDRAQGQEAPEVRRLRPRGRRARLGEPRPRLPDGGAAAAHARGDRRAPPRADPGAAAASAHRLAARALRRARRRRARPRRRASPRARPRRGRGPAGAVLPHRGSSPAAHRRLRARRRHHGRQLLRPGARRGLRLRGAHLLPRRPGRPADAAVHPAPGLPRPCPTRRSSAPPPCTRCCRAGGHSLQGDRAALEQGDPVAVAR